MKRILVIATVLVASCVTSKSKKETAADSNNSIVINGKLFTALYQQKSAEYKALCYQAYNIAKMRLDQYQPQSNLPKAIVTDIDETVLDNSPNAVHQALLGKEYEPQAWYEWSIQSNADTVPGSASFLKYASSKGVEIYYITNRLENERQSTLSNLNKFGYPNADDSHLLLKSTTSSKEVRRQQVAASHEIIMLLGDNLADFSSLFDKNNPTERIANTNNAVNDFGNRFIVIPNPVYGDWEGTLWNYNYKLTAAQKDSIYRTLFKTY